jgi:hypothetical protein
MKLKDKARPSIPQLDPGTYIGLCVGIYGIGEQENTYKDKTRYVEQIIFTFEFPSETIEIDGEMKPRQLSRTFTASVSEKGGLRKFLKSWRGKDFSNEDEMGDFEIFSLLGTSALLNVIQNDKGYSNIDTVMPLPKGMDDPSSDTALLSFDVDEWNDDTYALLPGWVQEKVQNSSQYKKAHAPDTAVDFPEVSEDVEATKAAETPAEGSRVERKGVAPF